MPMHNPTGLDLAYVQAAIQAGRFFGHCIIHWRERDYVPVFMAALNAVPGYCLASSDCLPLEVYERVYSAALEAVELVLEEREYRRHKRANR